MTNTDKLMSIVREQGFTKVDIASFLGITRQGLHKKLSNESEFKQSEIEKLSTMLKLSVEQEREIFFAQ